MGKVKPRIIKNFEKLDDDFRELIMQAYPNGYANEICMYNVGGGKFMSALPFETEEYSYLIKFPVNENVDLDDDMPSGDEDEMNIEGLETDEEEDDEDDIETSMDNIEDLEIADED
jgi:hypothetical protein